MGMMGMFKWLRKDIIQRERNGWNLSPKQCSLNNESYRNALQAFIDRRRFSDDTSVDTGSQSSPERKADYFSKNTNSRNNNNNNRNDKEWKTRGCKAVVPGIPHVLASEIFEIGWVAGTEDRYLELIFAEWQNTRVSLKRHTHPECRDAQREDLEVLTEIRHPNILLLMGTTQTEDHGLVSIFESIDCTLYSYIHDQGERISIQGIAKSGGKLADALRHSHMRGYVHGAISSHCVYLASSGTIKLGGWELAVHIKSPNREREYEERLRSEIYQWLAPEIFSGCEPRKESDVYGLALLIWEMCTTHVPWSGLSKSDVEKQYSFWKRGVLMTDLCDFPPLVYNVLEAGLQLDVNKRTLDMNRMRRFLRRLEMQYEDEDAIYVDQFANNNNEAANTYVISPERSHTTTSGIAGSTMPKQLLAAAVADVSRGPKSDSNLQRVNVFNDSGSEKSKSNTASRQHKSTSALSNVHAHNEVNCSVVKQTTNNVLHPWNSTYRKVKLSKDILEAQQISITPAANHLADTSDAENAQAMIKRLKELTAKRRERFFYGTDVPKQSTHTTPPKTSPRAKNKVLVQARSKDYEPHKPASHKTSLEPKFCKSPGEYDPSTFTKFPCSQCRGPFCTSTSSGVKTGSIIPQVLNSDKDFFESSLWRKEKLICISKMRKPGQEDETAGEESQGQINLEASKTVSPRFESTRSDATYVINGKSSADTTRTTNSGHASHTIETETTFGSKETSNTENEPLQVLKNALDRATEIICSTEELSAPPSTKFFDTFDQTTNSERLKSIFEEIYGLKSTDNEEIKTIERSDTDNHTFLLSPKKNSSANESSKHQNSTYNSEVHEKSEQSLPEAGRSRNFVCESIAEISNESNASQEKIDDACAAISDYFTRKNEEASCFKDRNAAIQDSSEISLGSRDSNGGNYPFILLNDQAREKGCRSCYKHALPRRRSLPAALGHLKGINHSALGKLPIRKGGIPDNTVEDLYIDDEFGDSLNVNMVLHDDDVSLDEDFLPETSEF